MVRLVQIIQLSVSFPPERAPVAASDDEELHLLILCGLSVCQFRAQREPLVLVSHLHELVHGEFEITIRALHVYVFYVYGQG